MLEITNDSTHRFERDRLFKKGGQFTSLYEEVRNELSCASEVMAANEPMPLSSPSLLGASKLQGAAAKEGANEDGTEQKKGGGGRS